MQDETKNIETIGPVCSNPKCTDPVIKGEQEVMYKGKPYHKGCVPTREQERIENNSYT
jgi:hypothetical protein